jgi:hypothetical protein
MVVVADNGEASIIIIPNVKTAVSPKVKEVLEFIATTLKMRSHISPLH